MARSKTKAKKIRVSVSLTGNIATRVGARLNYTLNLNPDFTIGHIVAMIRKQIQLNEFEAIFVFCKGRLLPMSVTCASIAENGKVEISLSSENCFGGNSNNRIDQLPNDIQNLIKSFLLPSREEIARNHMKTMRSIRIYREIFLPGDEYTIRAVCGFVNMIGNR